MRVLITGGLGNLGSWLTHHFSTNGVDVDVLAHRPRELTTSVPYTLLTADITDPASLDTALQGKKYDVVLHTASVNDAFVKGYAELALQVNAMGTRNLLEALSRVPGAALPHFIYFSTFHVYGKYHGEITEKTPTLPLNDYGATHLFAEHYVRMYHHHKGLPYSIIRLSNSYGCPRDYDSSKWYLILNDLSRMAFEKQEIILQSAGTAYRDFISMEDVCDVIYRLSLLPAPNDTFNLSSESPCTLLEVAQEVQRAYHRYKNEKIDIQRDTTGGETAEEPIYIRSQKIKKLVSYTPHNRMEGETIRIFEMLSSKE